MNKFLLLLALLLAVVQLSHADGNIKAATPQGMADQTGPGRQGPRKSKEERKLAKEERRAKRMEGMSDEEKAAYEKKQAERQARREEKQAERERRRAEKNQKDSL